MERNSAAVIIGMALVDQEFGHQLLMDPYRALADKGLGRKEFALLTQKRARSLQELARRVFDWETRTGCMPALLPVPNLNPALGYRQVLSEARKIVREREGQYETSLMLEKMMA